MDKDVILGLGLYMYMVNKYIYINICVLYVQLYI